MARRNKRVKTRGGKKFTAFMDLSRKQMKELGDTNIEAGFKGRVAPLAKALEFGIPRSNVPERPAFRQALPDVVRDTRSQAKRRVRFGGKGRYSIENATEAMAGAAQDAIIKSYEAGDTTPVGEVQEARKRGTKGDGQPLTGSRGPKLIGHIGAWVDGKPIDGEAP